MESNQGKCCWCLCKRSCGVKIVFFWSLLALCLITSEMINKFGPNSRPYMIPILVVIASMVVTSGLVFFIHRFNTEIGRYLVFLIWFLGITLAWNIWWWFLLANNFDGLQAPAW